MKMVPVIETTRMIAVLMKPVSIPPCVKAMTKLSKFSQFDGGSSGPVERYSAGVLNARAKIVTIGSSAKRHATTSAVYFSTVATHPPSTRRRRFGAGTDETRGDVAVGVRMPVIARSLSRQGRTAAGPR